MEVSNGDIVIVNLGDENVRVGCEQRGSRPCVVVSNNKANLHGNIIIVCPISSKKKHNIPTHCSIELSYESIVMCEQIISVDRTKIKKFVRKATSEEMKNINECLKVALNLKNE